LFKNWDLMESQQLMEKFYWALRTSVLRRSRLVSLGILLVYLQSFWSTGSMKLWFFALALWSGFSHRLRK